MNKFAATLIAIGTIAAATPALADNHVEVIERDARGTPTKVMIEGKEYLLCSATVQDSCINPRDAGMNFGNRELDYWPGQPASASDAATE